LCIQFREALVGKVYLATHFQCRGDAATDQFQGYRVDGADITGNVLASRAITARCGTHQPAVGIEQADGKAVQLGLGSIIDRLGFQALAHTAVEVCQLFIGKGIIQRQHALFVAHLAEGLHRWCADALGG